MARTLIYRYGMWSGNQVAALRQAFGLTLEEVARALDLGTYASVWRWEQGKALPSKQFSKELDRLEVRLKRQHPSVEWVRPEPVVPAGYRIVGVPPSANTEAS